MNKKIVFISFFVFVVLFLGFFQLRNFFPTSKSDLEVSQLIASSVAVSSIPVSKIEVVHFHGTQQCISCIRVGEFALKTIQEKFPNEYASGKIVFMEVNGELPENRTMVVRYQARGSSLFVNTIRGDEDNIAEDTTVWRLVSNEKQYMNYFEEKIKLLLIQ